jgi:arabinose-5-phosphate isomerase
MAPINILAIAKRTIRMEMESIAALDVLVGPQFEKAVYAIHKCGGRLVVSGVGKSALIAQKIAATLNGTGTPSLYMHAADAIHGDLGMIQPQDMVMVLSKSGNSPEIRILVPLIKSFHNQLIGMVGNMDSFLSQQADIVLDTTVKQEACPNNLAPTSSTTAQMVMGDALAVCLMELNQFSSADFARLHPGGTLGKKLYLHVSDLLVKNEVPAVPLSASLREVIMEMTKKRLGATGVIHEDGTTYGIVTDGDLRRMLGKNIAIDHLTAKDICTAGPKSISPNALAVNALDMLRENDITQLVVETDHKYLGIIHLHDLINEGLI